MIASKLEKRRVLSITIMSCRP